NAITEAVIGRTVSRQILGSMNDFVRMLDSYRGAGSLLEVSLRLAETPCGPLRMNSPREETNRGFSRRTPPEDHRRRVARCRRHDHALGFEAGCRLMP